VTSSQYYWRQILRDSVKRPTLSGFEIDPNKEGADEEDARLSQVT
jgi:hypothetical protein